MAKMYPEHIDVLLKATEAEKKVFHFLKKAAKPHKNFTVWHRPPIGVTGKGPSFILYGQELGLLVLVVRPWTLSQITTATPIRFTIRVSGKNEKRESPDKKAKQYVHMLEEKLKGRLKIPVGRMVIFPNIQRQAYCKRGIHWLIPMERVLLQDDISPTGEIACDVSGRRFSQAISSAFPSTFKGLKREDISQLALVIQPECQIQLPRRRGAEKTEGRMQALTLDHAQSRLALQLGKGHQIIKGPSGSGKTLILVERCCHLYTYNPHVKKILLVCFNIVLVSYLKRLIQDKALEHSAQGIAVCHYFELCSQILGEPVHYENEDALYYDRVIKKARDKVAKGELGVGPFDAVFIDEGQDFSNEMLKTILPLLRPKGDLVICLDPDQDLYRKKASWKAIGIKASGRTRHLKSVYRNTEEIKTLAQRFLGKEVLPPLEPALPTPDLALHGDPPELRCFSSQDEAEDFLSHDLRAWLDQRAYQKSEIAILYDDKVYGSQGFAYDNRALPMRIVSKLASSGIPATWVSRDAAAKQRFDVTADQVSIISIHSAKGLDFDLVYLMGLDHIHATEKTRHKLISLIYVAMTRAKHRLIIPYVEETEFIARMKG